MPFGLYYGSVDATPLFVLLAGALFRAHRRSGNPRRRYGRTSRRAGLDRRTRRRDGDGFVEYRRGSAQGLVNQGWKDSQDAIFHADGRLAEGAIALAEVQGYVFAAKTVIARIGAAHGPGGRRSAGSKPTPSVSPGASRTPSGARISAPTRWRSTGTSGLAGSARRMPDTAVRRHRVARTRREVVKDCSSRVFSRAGACARSRRARRATIPCLTTTARSGRTTTR